MSGHKNSGIKLFYSLLITIGVGAIAGFATASSISTWYTFLLKPGFTPPNWLFGSCLDPVVYSYGNLIVPGMETIPVKASV